MNKNYITKKLSLLALSVMASASLMAQDLTNGVFVLNEGGGGSGNASVFFIENGVSVPYSDLYTSANPIEQPLGDVAQSMSFEGDNAYIILNMSNSLKIVDRVTFELVDIVDAGLINPRYMAFHNGKGYITNWGGSSITDDYIAVLDLETNTITGTIPVEMGVERILTYNDKLYVAHQGAFGYNNLLSVINTGTNTVEQTITVGDIPNRMVVKDGFLYVICGGNPMWAPTETDGSLVKIDLSNNTVTETTPYAGLHPWHMNFDSDGNFYFSSDADIYKGSLSAPANITEIASLEPQGAYGVYGMDIIDNKLYVADAGNYVSPGTAYIFSATGEQLNSYEVGVIPNSFYKAASSLSVPGFNSSAVAIYPNPAAGRFFLTTDKATEVALYDVTGKQVLKAVYSVSGVDVSVLPSGIYMVKIASEAGSTMKKLIIQ